MLRALIELIERIATAAGWNLELAELQLSEQDVAGDLEYGRYNSFAVAELAPPTLH
jgi:hypothetical protein